MRDILKLGSILMAYTLLAGLCLALVYNQTAPIIEAQRAAATGDEAMLKVLPGMEGGFEAHDQDSDFPYWVGYEDPQQTTVGGYVFITSQQGYQSVIETMVGVDADGTITGTSVIAQQETPGLGDRITEVKSGQEKPWFMQQFVGRNASEFLAVGKDGGDIEAITGATISSRAVTESINQGLAKLMEKVAGGSFEREEAPEAPVEEEPDIEVTDELLAGMLSNMSGGFEQQGADTSFPYWVGYADPGQTDVGGYAFTVTGTGFQSDITSLVATDASGTILDVKILHQDETPDYGTRITEVREGYSEPWFPQQYEGLSSPDEVALSDSGGEVDAISGATVTSRAVTTSIREGLSRLHTVISGEEPAPAPADEPEEPVSEPAESAPSEPPNEAMQALPGMDGGFGAARADGLTYWIGYEDADQNTVGGYVFTVTEEGFQSDIRTLVAVDINGIIIDVRILSQDETPGYGTKITEVKEGETEPWFPEQFEGVASPANVALSEEGGTIDAITGATITSKAVVESVRGGYETLLAELGLSTADSGAAGEGGGEMPVEPPEEASDALPGMDGGFGAAQVGGLTYWIGYEDAEKNTVGGYVFTVTEEGFQSDITTLVATDADGIITNVRILSQDETPGYGTKITEVKEGESEPWFTRQFEGIAMPLRLELSEDGGAIDAITGATITSRAVVESVREGYETLLGAIVE